MRITLLVLTLALLGGCVGKGRYNSLLSDYEALLVENEKMNTQLAACQERKKTPAPMRVRDGQR